MSNHADKWPYENDVPDLLSESGLFDSTYWDRASSDTHRDCTAESLLAAMIEARRNINEYLHERDARFQKLRDKGYPIWSWNEGPAGETWVVGEELWYDLIIATRKKPGFEVTTKDFHPVPTLYGVQIMTLSAAIAFGFDPDARAPKTYATVDKIPFPIISSSGADASTD